MHVLANVKNLLLATIITSFMLPIISCKKGSDDPFISLRSRNQRLIGKWTIVESNSTRERTFAYPGTNDTATTKRTFKNNNGNIVFLMNGQISNPTAYEGSASIEFKADGTISYTEKHNASVDIIDLTLDGYWVWRQTAKSKYTLEITDEQGIGLGTIFGGGVFNLQRLSNNDITLESSSITTSNNPTTGETNKTKLSALCILERKK